MTAVNKIKKYAIVDTQDFLDGTTHPKNKHHFPFDAIKAGKSFIVTEKNADKFKSLYDTIRSVSSAKSRDGVKSFSTTKLDSNTVMVSRNY